ncbi:hypothetical protein HDU67_002271 [Dinochytrium kinnereticum]|nr:hypothetical protein HDU67_002271 [Dinochytrium kinnereticum]
MFSLSSHYSTLNKVILMGNLGKDPEFYPSNVKVEDGQNVRGMWRFTLATNRSVKRGEEWVKEVQWHNIKVYSTSTSPVFTTGRISKGFVLVVSTGFQLILTRANVTIDGRLEYRRDEESQRTYTDIVAGV